MAPKSLQQIEAEAEQKLRYQAAVNAQKLQQQQALDALKQQQVLSQLGGGESTQRRSTGNPLLDAVDQYILSEKATSPWSQTGRALSQVRLPQTDNPWEAFLGSAVQGLGTGLFSQLGEDEVLGQFQEELAPVASSIIPGLDFSTPEGGSLDIDAARLNILGAAQEQENLDELERLAARYGVTGERRGSRRDRPYTGDIFGGPGLEVNLAGALPGVDEVAQAMSGAENTLADETYQLARKLSGGREPTAAALDSADRIMKSRREEQGSQYAKIDEAAQKSSDLLTYASEIEKAVEQAGATGFYGDALQSVAGLLSPLSESQKGKFTGGLDLKKFGVEAIKEFGPAFKGPMSDKDVEIMLSKIPGVDKTEEFNLNYAKKLRAVAAMNELYTDYMYEMRDKNVPAREANRRYELLKRANPLVVNGEINPIWLSGDPYEQLVNTPSAALDKKAAAEMQDEEAPEAPDLTGAQRVGTKNGKPAYRLKNGKIWVSD